MTEMLTIRMPKEDVEAFMRVVDDIELIKEAETGDKEIEKGKFIKLEELEKKYKNKSLLNLLVAFPIPITRFILSLSVSVRKLPSLPF